MSSVGVLVVDDYSPNLFALESLLAPLCAVTLVDSGERALQEIGRRDYAVVILDIRMPGMDGIELACRIRSGTRNAQVPIIFVTAMDSDAAPTLDGYAVGAVDYLRRPIEPLVLRAKVSIFVELHRSREQAKQESIERARLEAERAAAEQASREKDQFLALLSHELRTPLTSILLWTDMLINKELPPDTLRRGLEILDVCAQHEANIVDNVLEMSRFVRRTVALELSTFDIDQLLAEAVAAVSRFAARRQVTVARATTLTGAREARGDRARLFQVLRNVLDNAIKFSPVGGHVDVVLEDADPGFRIRIEDTGVGFSSSVRAELFSRFHPGDDSPADSRRGLGLGLALARAVLALHGGTILGESEGDDRGASFTITLPTTLPAESPDAFAGW